MFNSFLYVCQRVTTISRSFSWAFPMGISHIGSFSHGRLQLQQPQEAMLLHWQDPAEGSGGTSLHPGGWWWFYVVKTWVNYCLCNLSFGSVSKPCTPSSSHQNSWYLWMFIPLKMVLIGIDPYPFMCGQ